MAIFDSYSQRFDEFFNTIKQELHEYYFSDAFEFDVDEWTKRINTSLYDDQNFDNVLDRDARLKLKLKQLFNKLEATTVQGAREGFLASVITINPKAIIAAIGVGASIRFGKASGEGMDVLIKRYFSIKRKYSPATV